MLPSLQDRLGPGATYLLFAGVGVAAVATIAAIVPVRLRRPREQECVWCEEVMVVRARVWPPRPLSPASCRCACTAARVNVSGTEHKVL